MTFRRRALVLAVVAVGGCKEHEPPAPTEPWLATPSQTASGRAVATRIERYVVASPSTVSFSLGSKKAKLHGVFQTARGELQVQPEDLALTRGTVAIDLASLQMAETADAGTDSLSLGVRAKHWLDLTREKTARQTERLRWAEFTLESIEHISAERASRGKLVRVPDAGASEVRRVHLRVKGKLLLHNHRIEQILGVSAYFYFGADSGPEPIPEQIVLEFDRPLSVSLTTFDIRPRDDEGRFVASEASRFGRELERPVRVEAKLLLSKDVDR